MARPVINQNALPLNSRYGDNAVVRQLARNLPMGACNFTNLSIGSAARCGCQRFYDRAEYAGGFVRNRLEFGDAETTGWCMCEHHACFHEMGRAEEDATVSPTTMRFQRQSSPGRDASLQSTYQGPLNASVVLSQEGTLEKNARESLENARKEDNAQMSTTGRMETESFKGDGRGSLRYSYLQNPMLPDIPSQCLLPSNISSGSIAGGSLSFKSAASPNRRMENKVEAGPIHDWIPQPLRAASLTESLTDVASPMSRFMDDVESRNANMDRTMVEAMDIGKTRTSMATSKSSSQAVSVSLPTGKDNSTSLVLRPIFDADYSKMDIDADSNAAGLRRISPHASEIYKHYGTNPTLKETLQNHEDRLDHLENASHSCVAVTETDRNCDCDCDLLSHKHEKIECRMDRVEKALASKLHRGLGLVDDGNASVSEFSTSLTSTGHAELYSRIDSRIEILESRVNILDNSVPPSATHPWEFDVIFLPFGTDLNRVWTSHGSFSSQASRYSGTQEPTSSQHLTDASAQRFFTKAPKEQSWEHLLERYNAKADLYSGKVCGIDSVVDQRLRSRGLVRTIQIKGPDAQHVHFSMFEAFGGLLEEISVLPFSKAKVPSNIPRKLRRYREALSGSWIPLRKLHKNSRLRFLETSEMVTSTLWTPSFLAEIAMQQSGRRRLYITNKDGYLQHVSDSSPGWTWEKIRQLPHYSETDLSSTSSDDFHPSHSIGPNQLQIHELCWDWNEKLDGPETYQTVTTQHLSTQHPPLSIRGPPMSDSDSSSSSAASSAAPYSSPLHSHTPASEPARHLLSPLTERNLSHSIHTRTTSMPTSVPLSFGPSQPKRRIACFEEHARSIYSSSSLKSFLPIAFAPKRQRTRSPSRHRDTPRWSAEPPSPYVFEEEREHKRGLTPFAYATPFSNAPYNYERPRSKGDDWGNEGDGSLTDEFDADKGRNEEYESDNTDQVRQGEDEAWEGVRDGGGSADDDEKDGEERDDGDDDFEATALSDGKDEDAESETNSTPSEYPSTQPVAMYADDKGTFEIHVDDDEE